MEGLDAKVCVMFVLCGNAKINNFMEGEHIVGLLYRLALQIEVCYWSIGFPYKNIAKKKILLI